LLRYRLGFALAAAFLGAGCFTSPVNMSPTVRIDAPSTPVVRGQPAPFTATASDPDGDSLTVLMNDTAGPCPKDFDLPAQWPSEGWNALQPHQVSSPEDPFCVWAKATDRYGAISVDAVTENPQDHAPTAVIALVSPAETSSFPVGSSFVLSAQGSTDPDTGDAAQLKFTWTLKSAPTTTPGILNFCADSSADMSKRCLKADVAGDYDVAVRVTDPAGMDSVAERTLHVVPGALPVAVIDLVAPTGTPIPLGSKIKFSGARSMFQDTTTQIYKWTLDPAPGSMAATAGCDGDATGQTQCFVADVSGTYHETLVVTNGTGDSQPVTATFVVAPDQPPCIDQTTPDLTTPVTTMTTFAVGSVSDDLDPFPSAQNMQWFQSIDGGPFAPMTKDFPSFNVTGASFGDVVKVRLEVHDRNTDRSAKEFAACGDADVCSMPSLIHPDTCIQRMTWTVHILP
jgi:hypothetical protein